MALEGIQGIYPGWLINTARGRSPRAVLIALRVFPCMPSKAMG